jgi:hypothetical protein
MCEENVTSSSHLVDLCRATLDQAALTTISKMQYRRLAEALEPQNAQGRRVFLARRPAMLDEIDRKRLYTRI